MGLELDEKKRFWRCMAPGCHFITALYGPRKPAKHFGCDAEQDLVIEITEAEFENLAAEAAKTPGMIIAEPHGSNFPQPPPRESVPMTKDDSKTPFRLLCWPFLAALARHMAEGVRQDERRSEGDWKRLTWGPNVEARYREAIIRHTVEKFDPLAIASNAMIIWFHNNRGEE